MIDDVIHACTRHLLTNYLSPLDAGPWTIQGACVTARPVHRYGLPADAVTMRLLIEEPDQGWAVAVEVVQRGGKLWRIRVEGYFDEGDSLGPAGVRLAYLDWLRAL
jgi:hypothetical protein